MSYEHISPNRLTLMSVKDGAWVHDGTALYIDNLIEVFKAYEGGSLLTLGKALYHDEMQLIVRQPDDHIKAGIKRVWEISQRLFDGESEEGLQAMRRAWMKDPEGTISRAFRMLREGEQQLEVYPTAVAPPPKPVTIKDEEVGRGTIVVRPLIRGIADGGTRRHSGG